MELTHHSLSSQQNVVLITLSLITLSSQQNVLITLSLHNGTYSSLSLHNRTYSSLSLHNGIYSSLSLFTMALTHHSLFTTERTHHSLFTTERSTHHSLFTTALTHHSLSSQQNVVFITLSLITLSLHNGTYSSLSSYSPGWELSVPLSELCSSSPASFPLGGGPSALSSAITSLKESRASLPAPGSSKNTALGLSFYKCAEDLLSFDYCELCAENATSRWS